MSAYGRMRQRLQRCTLWVQSCEYRAGENCAGEIHSTVWYYLFDRPSCSAFYEPAYARSAGAQREVIAELKLYRPFAGARRILRAGYVH